MTTCHPLNRPTEGHALVECVNLYIIDQNHAMKMTGPKVQVAEQEPEAHSLTKRQRL